MPTAEPASANRIPLEGDRELGSVVIATESQDLLLHRWHVRLRPWFFCLVTLIVAELVARVYFDGTLCLEPERFDNYPSIAMENAFIGQMRRDAAYKVVMIGDSTVVGSSLLDKSETVPRLLETELQSRVPDRRIHVWNMSIAGARATDELCVLLSVLSAKPDIVIVEANYFMADMDVSGLPLMYPWLAYNLPSVPGSLVSIVPKRDWKRRFEDGVKSMVEDHIRLVGLRQAINAKVFGVQPRREPFEAANPAVMLAVGVAKRLHKLKLANWRQTGLDPKVGWDYKYGVHPIGHDNFNRRYFREIIETLWNHRTKAVAYLTPQNPAITHTVMTPQWYAGGRRVLQGFLTGQGVVAYDYSDLVPNELFEDNDHMLAEGNRRLAAALASVLTPRIKESSTGAAVHADTGPTQNRSNSG